MFQLIIPYQRPVRLSDPGCDFSEQLLKDILKKQDTEMGFYELVCLFQGVLPAGNYRESVYFLPLALKYILTGREEAETLCDNLLVWMSCHFTELKCDNLFLPVQNALCDLFHRLIKTYRIEHTDYPLDGAMVTTLIMAWNGHECYEKLGDRLLENTIAKLQSYEDAAWFCYCIDDFFSGLIHPENSAIIENWSKNAEMQEKACTIILKKSMESNFLLRYWDKILVRCGLI